MPLKYSSRGRFAIFVLGIFSLVSGMRMLGAITGTNAEPAIWLDWVVAPLAIVLAVYLLIQGARGRPFEFEKDDYSLLHKWSNIRWLFAIVAFANMRRLLEAESSFDHVRQLWIFGCMMALVGCGDWLDRTKDAEPRDGQAKAEGEPAQAGDEKPAED